jgi:hypothetical protein
MTLYSNKMLLKANSLFAIVALSTSAGSTSRAEASCANTLLKFTEYGSEKKVSANPNEADDNVTNATNQPQPPAPTKPPGKLEGRQISAYLRCDGDAVNVPQVTTMHFLEAKNGQTCYHDRACGNVKSWGVYVGISGVWDWFNSSSNFFEGPAFNQYVIETKSNSRVVQVDLAVQFGQIERYCKPISQEICL